MTDTQWSRFQVFLQENETEPHRNVGTVHAPDPEMALQNARDVFVRRPGCASLWVVPADQIYSRTAQELEHSGEGGAVDPSAPIKGYHVFAKLEHWGTHTYVGRVEAAAPSEAVRAATTTFDERDVLAWWVFASVLVNASDPDDVESMFHPALDKHFRDQSQYQTVTLMREIQKPPDPQEDAHAV